MEEPVVTPPPAQQVAKHSPAKKVSLVIGTLLLFALFLGTGFYVGQNTKPSTPQPTAAPLPTELPDPTNAVPRTKANGIPLTPNTVSVIYENGTPNLRYRATLYGEDEGNTYTPKAFPNQTFSDDIPWIGLVNAPDNAIANNGFDEVFSFKSIPSNRRNFLFVMRWSLPGEKDTVTWQLSTFFYEYEQNKLTPLILTKNKYPKISSISADGKYAAFFLFDCWNCGGHTPSTEVVNLTTGSTKNIGQTKNFTWKENGAYEYKEYIVIPCDPPQEGPVECSEDEASLPIKTGSI